MSRGTIDKRIVQMELENAKFEQNAKTSIKTLESLKKGLDLDKSAKNLAGLERAGRNFSLAGIASSVSDIQSKFTLMGRTTMMIFDDIARTAINTGRRVVDALTVEPVRTGLQEYETQINAIQTILANTESKGTNLKQVNAALDELNHYADMTIYNFTEMTRNIGTFTAAGVDLDTSVAAIKGIANLAAVSGSTSQQASTAMYQLSQALASGTVKLMDWNSVVNAGMGGQVFQDAIKETAKVHGIAIDDMIEKEGSFRETLSKGWLSSDILIETLQKFTGDLSKEQLKTMGYTEEQIAGIVKMGKTAQDAATKVKTFTQLVDTTKEAAQSGWTQTWEYIIGDFEQAKELWTGVSDFLQDIINKSSDARNEVVGGSMMSGWEKLEAAVEKAGMSSEDFEKRIQSALNANHYRSDLLVQQYGSIENAIKAGAVRADVLKQALKGVSGTSIEMSKFVSNMSFGSAGDDVTELQEALKGLGYEVGEVNGQLGEETSEAIKKFQEANGLVVDGICGPKTIEALRKSSKAVEGLEGDFTSLIDHVTDLGGREMLIESFKNVFASFGQVIGGVKQAFSEVFPPITAENVTALISKFYEFTKTLSLSEDTIKKIHDAAKGLFNVFGIGQDVVSKLGKAGLTYLKRYLPDIKIDFLGVAANAGNAVTAFRAWLKENHIISKSIVSTHRALSNGVSSIKEWIGSFVEIPDIKENFEKLKNWIVAWLSSFSSEIPGQVGGIFSSVLSAVSTGLSKIKDFLSGFNFKIKLPDFTTLTKIFTSIGEKISDSGGIFTALFIGISKAVKMLEELAKGGAFTAILFQISKFIKGFKDTFEELNIASDISDVLNSIGDTFEAFQTKLKAGTMLKMAGAIGILAAALFIISTIDSEKIALSLGAIGAMFIELIEAMKAFSKIDTIDKSVIKSSGVMIKLAAAILILSIAMKNIASLDIAGVAKSLIAIDFLMMEFQLFLNSVDTTMTKSVGFAMIEIAASILILSKAMEQISTINIEGIIKSLVSIGVLFRMLSSFTQSVSGSENMVSIGAGLILLAAAMAILSKSMITISGISIEGIIKSIASIGALLFILSKSLNSIQYGDSMQVAAGLLILAASIRILSKSMVLLSNLSWEGIAKSIVALAGSLIIMVTALNNMNGSFEGSVALLAVAAALAILAPALLAIGALSWESIAKGLITLAGAFAIIGVAGTLLQPVIPAILALSGAFALIGVVIAGIGVGLLAAGVGLTALSVGITALAGSSVAVLSSFVANLKIVIEAVISFIPDLMVAFGEGFISMIGVIGDSAEAIGKTLKQLVLMAVDVLIDCVPQLTEALLTTLISVLDSLVSKAPVIIDDVMKFLIAVMNGVAARAPELVHAFVNMVQSIIVSIGNEIISILGTMLPGIEGYLQTAWNAITKIFSIAANALSVVIEFIAGIIGKLSGFFSSVFEAIKPYVSGAWGVIQNVFQAAFDVISSVVDWLGTKLGNLVDFFSNGFESAKPIVSGAWGIIQDAFSFAASVIGTVVNTIGGILGSLGSLFRSGLEILAPIAEGAWSLVQGTFTVAGTIISGAINGISIVLSGIGDLFSKALGGLASIASGAWNGVTSAFESAGNFISEHTSGITTLIKDLPNSISDGLANLPNIAKEALDGLVGSFQTALDNLGDIVGGMVDFVTNMGQGIIDGLQSVVDFLGGCWDGITGFFSDGAEDIGDSAETAKTNTDNYKVISESISNMVPEVQAAWSSVNDKYLEGVNNLTTTNALAITAFAQLTSSAKEALKSVKLAMNNTTKAYSNVSTDGAKKAGVDAAAAMSNGIASATKQASGGTKANGASLITSLISGIDSKKGSAVMAARTAAYDIVNALKNGIESKKGSAVSAMNSVMASLFSAATGGYSTMSNAGYYIALGLARGIENNRSLPISAAVRMVSDAIHAANDRAEIASPSKVFKKMGYWMDKGLAVGLETYSYAVEAAASDVSGTAIDTVSTNMKDMNGLLSDEINLSPSIRPIVDLENVRSSANEINGMLSTNRTFGLDTSGVGALSTSMRSIQNAKSQSADLVTEIQKLGKQLQRPNNTTYRFGNLQYNKDSDVAGAIETLVRAARIEGRA